MWKQMMPGLRMTVLMTVLTGLIYPGVVTAICQAVFRGPANGSLLYREGKVVGSTLIGQSFTRPEYFHGRPSAAGASNLGPTSRKLVDRVRESVAKVRDGERVVEELPSDLVTASASGLDPHVSPASARLQVARVAAARGVAAESLMAMVEENIEGRDLGFLGEARVNVLVLNMKLDGKFGARASR